MFLWFELSFDLLTCVNRLDNGINLSTVITELKARIPSGQDSSILSAWVANHSARFGSSCPLTELVV